MVFDLPAISNSHHLTSVQRYNNDRGVVQEKGGSKEGSNARSDGDVVAIAPLIAPHSTPRRKLEWASVDSTFAVGVRLVTQIAQT